MKTLKSYLWRCFICRWWLTLFDFHYFCCKPSKMLSFSSITIILVVSLFVKLWIVNGHLIILFFFFFIKHYLGVFIVWGDLFIIGERFIIISVVDVICVILNTFVYLLLASWMSFNFFSIMLDDWFFCLWFRWRFRYNWFELLFFYFLFFFTFAPIKSLSQILTCNK